MWTLPVPPLNEAERLRVLHACGIMDMAPDERFDRLTRLAARFYDADVAFIGLVDNEAQWLMSVSSDALIRSVHRHDCVCNMIVESGNPMVVGNMQADPRLKGHPLVPRLDLSFYAGAPILMRGELVIGTLCVMRREPGDAEAFDLGPLTDLAAIAGDEIAHLKLNMELKRQSETDPLTGLPNRRIFDDVLAKALRRTDRTGQPLSLLMVDLDRFKALNDLAGHHVGDQVLKRVGALLAGLPHRPLDAVARIGGEEFAVVLPDTDASGAEKVAENLLATLREAKIPHPAGGFVTASVGGATQAGAPVASSHLFLLADAALYEAKRSGRNTSRFLSRLGEPAALGESTP